MTSPAYYRAAGLNVRALLKHKLEHPRGLLEGFDDCETLPPDALLGLGDVDILIPAAVGGVITEENVDQIQAKVIVEGANGRSIRSLIAF